MSSLTPSQQRALNLDKNISVTAGAGSGKTAVLVKRFLKIVLQDSSKVRRVLAITFTKKAAAEMRERVAEKINELLDEESEPMVQARLLRVRDQLNSAYISTIHSFCSSILHE
ncbi:MAG TPA: helicase, partial [Calditrichaeota bacterium]|nr:helicase [Calditrichota bacterium]